MSLDDYLKSKEVNNDPQPAPVESAPEPVAQTTPEQQPVIQQPPVVPSGEPVVQPRGDQAPKPSFNISDFNLFFGTSLKEENELKDVLRRATEYGDIEKKYTEAETTRKTLEEKTKELEANLDPLQYFSSPDAYVAEQIRRQLGDKVDPSVVTRLLSHDKTKMADFDLLAHDYLMHNPDTIGGMEGAREVIADKYKVDPTEPTEEWSRLAQNMIMAEAREAEKRITHMKGEVKVPQPLTREALEAQRLEAVQKKQAAWAPYINEIAGFDKLIVPGESGTPILEMEVPKAFRDTLPDYVKGVIEKTGLEPNPDNLREIIDYRNRMFVYEHLPRILEVHGNNIRSELEKAKHDLLNNTVPPNTTVSPQPAGPVPGTGARELLSGTKRSRLGR